MLASSRVGDLLMANPDSLPPGAGVHGVFYSACQVRASLFILPVSNPRLGPFDNVLVPFAKIVYGAFLQAGSDQYRGLPEAVL